MSTQTILNALHGVVMSLALLLLTALLIHEHGRNTGLSRRFSRTLRGSVVGPGSNTPIVIGKWLRILCIISVILCVCTCINDLVYYNVEMHSDGQCTAPRNLGVSLLTALDLSIYLFLWLRQYLVYRSIKMESSLSGRLARIFQWITLVLIVGIFLSTNSLIACCRRYSYNATSGRCYETTTDGVDMAISYLWSVGSVTLHCSLVLMFALPLVQVALKRASHQTETNKDSQKRMMALVRRCLVLSLACVVTDITVMLTTLYALADYPSQLRHLLYNTNVMLNCTFLVASFKEWKDMLFPCGVVRRRLSSVGIGTVTSTTGKENVSNPD